MGCTMRDYNLRQIITDASTSKIGWIKFGITVCATAVVSVGLTAAYYNSRTDRLSNDELAKLAEFAACSTGVPASTLWMSAHRNSDWTATSQIQTVRRLLVDIDVDRCSIREAANTDADDGEIWAFSPDNRKN